MNRLTLFLSPGRNHIKLETPIVTSTNSVMMVKNASIYWDSINIETGVNDTIVASESIVLGSGYWTFNMIRSYVQQYGIVMIANTWNNTCSIQAVGHDVNLKKIGPLLGFPENYVIPANSWRTSPKQVEINKSLRFVTIGCNIVNNGRNFNTHGKRSDIICTLPITSQQTLNGTVTSYGNQWSQIPLYNGVFSELFFNVNDNVFHKSSMRVLVEIEIKNPF